MDMGEGLSTGRNCCEREGGGEGGILTKKECIRGKYGQSNGDVLCERRKGKHEQ